MQREFPGGLACQESCAKVSTEIFATRLMSSFRAGRSVPVCLCTRNLSSRKDMSPRPGRSNTNYTIHLGLGRKNRVARQAVGKKGPSSGSLRAHIPSFDWAMARGHWGTATFPTAPADGRFGRGLLTEDLIVSGSLVSTIASFPRRRSNVTNVRQAQGETAGASAGSCPQAREKDAVRKRFNSWRD